MDAQEPARPRSFARTLRNVLITLGVILALGVLAVQWTASHFLLRLINERAKEWVRGELRVGRVWVNALGANVSFSQVRYATPPEAPQPVIFEAQDVTLDGSLASLVLGKPVTAKLHLKKPVLWLGPSFPGAALPQYSDLKLPAVPLSGLTVEEGRFQVATSTDPAGTFSLENIRLEIESFAKNMSTWPVVFQWSLELPGQSPGIIQGKLEARPQEPKINFQGHMKCEKLDLAYLAKYFVPPEAVTFTQGLLDLSSEFHCDSNYLVSSNIVSIENLGVQFLNRKKIWGLSTKKVETFLNVQKTSFVLPITGNIFEPQFGFTSAVQQILYQALQGQMDEEDLTRLAERGSRFVGKRIDNALKDLLKRRSKKVKQP